MVIGDVPFEDVRVELEDWPDFQRRTPSGGLPVAEIDGQMVAQSKSLLRYFGRLANLYPEDAFQALLVDEILETIGEFLDNISTARKTENNGTGKARQIALEKVLKEGGERYIGGCQQIIEDISDGPFVFGDKATVADVAVAGVFLFLRTGFLSLPADGLDSYHRMKKIYENVISIPQVVEYLKKHPVPGMDL